MHHVHRAIQKLVLTAGLASVGLPAHAQAVTTTREGGYEIKRWQVKTMASGSSVGSKTTDYETREGIDEETDGNSSKLVMTVGGSVKKCPSADGIVDGQFEYAMTRDDVNADVIPTEHRHFEKGITAILKGQVGPDAKLQYVDLEGDSRRGDGSPAQHIELRFTVDDAGMPDFEAMRQAVLMTGDMSSAIAIWYSAQNYKEAERVWLTRNQCVELAFDPPSNSREVVPGEAVEVRTWLRTFLDQSAVGEATLEATGLGGAQVSPRNAQAPEDGVVTFRYTAPQERRPPRGFDVIAYSRAGVATGEWRALDGLRLAIEHHLVSRRDVPGVLIGGPIFVGTVNFELAMEPFPTLPGEFRGETTVVREMGIGHIASKCTGSATQSETWRVNATVDPQTETLKLGLTMYVDEMDAFWDCFDGGRYEVTSYVGSELDLVNRFSMPARSGSRHEFTLNGPEFTETLTVTAP